MVPQTFELSRRTCAPDSDRRGHRNRHGDQGATKVGINFRGIQREHRAEPRSHTIGSTQQAARGEEIARIDPAWGHPGAEGS